MFPSVVVAHLINYCTADGCYESLNFFLPSTTGTATSMQIQWILLAVLNLSRFPERDCRWSDMCILYWNICCQVLLKKKVSPSQCLRALLTQTLANTCFISLFNLCHLDNLPVNWQLIALVAISLTSWASFHLFDWPLLFFSLNVFFYPLPAF